MIIKIELDELGDTVTIGDTDFHFDAFGALVDEGPGDPDTHREVAVLIRTASNTIVNVVGCHNPAATSALAVKLDRLGKF